MRTDWKQRVDAVVQDHLSPGEAWQAVEAWREALTTMSPNVEEHLESVATQSGIALNPYEAHLCLTDYQRSRLFCLGLIRAIAQAQARFPSEQIRVLYAGCGPYAPLLQPACSQYSLQQVQFTCVEINAESMAMAQATAEALGIGHYIAEWVQEDLLGWEPKDTYHVVLTETMQKALEEEGQVANTWHLAKFLKLGGLFLPEAITVTPALVLAGNPPPEAIMAGLPEAVVPLPDAYCLTSATLEAWPVILTAQVPRELGPVQALYLLTEVRVWEDLILQPGEGSLTFPIRVWTSQGQEGPPPTVFRLSLGPKYAPSWKVAWD